MPKYKPIAIEVKIALSSADVALVMQNSLERVLNNAIDCGNELEKHGTGDFIKESGSTLWQDCEELKPFLVKLWGLIQQESWKELAKSE